MILEAKNLISKEWIAIAKDRDRPKWQQTHSKPKPPDAWWLMVNLRVYGHNCYMQKDTQPIQTCSEGFPFPAPALYRGVSLYLGSIT